MVKFIGHGEEAICSSHFIRPSSRKFKPLKIPHPLECVPSFSHYTEEVNIDRRGDLQRTEINTAFPDLPLLLGEQENFWKDIFHLFYLKSFQHRGW